MPTLPTPTRRSDFAARIDQLGTETAFAVSAEAAAHAAKGHVVYPFHLGDLNIATPHNIIEAAHKALRDGKTGYCPPAGIPALREALADDINRSHGTHYGPEHVAVQPGGKPVIGKFFAALMNPGDEVLYPNPGYPIYESQIEYHGGVAVPYGYLPGATNFEIDLAGLEAAITPRTRFLVFNNLQNPTGAESSHEELAKVAEIALKHDLWVLADEAYFDIRYAGTSESLVSFPGMVERTVILYTFSKKYAMSGWRLGAAIGPKEVIDVLSKLNVNAESCTAQFVQVAGVEALRGDQTGTELLLARFKERRDLATEMLNSMPGVSCFKPDATFYLYPDVTDAMRLKGLERYDDFRVRMLEATGVSMTTRMHFGRPVGDETRRYVRLAYSGIGIQELAEGLERLKAWLEA